MTTIRWEDRVATFRTRHAPCARRYAYPDPISRTVPSGPVRYDLGPHFLTNTAVDNAPRPSGERSEK